MSDYSGDTDITIITPSESEENLDSNNMATNNEEQKGEIEKESLEKVLEDTERPKEVEVPKDSDERTRLMIQRKHARAAVTRIYNKWKSTLETDADDYVTIQTLVMSLDNKFKQLKEVEDNIQKITPISDLEKEITSFFAYMEKYDEAIDTTMELKQRNEESTKEAISHKNNTRVKFPPITIKHFSGRAGTIEWAEFFEIFDKSSEDMPVEQKILLLKSLLDEPASSILAGLRLTAENYGIIIDNFTKKYGSPRVIINRYVKLLCQFEQPKRGRNNEIMVKDLRKTYDKLQSYIRALLLVD